MTDNKIETINIEKINTQDEVAFCARLRASMDPWAKLERDYDDAVASITAPDHEAYVAKIGSDIAGFAVISVQGVLTGFVLTLCIVPGFQGYGIGSKLLAFCENRILEESPNVFLLVSDFNTGAQAFYYRHGYNKVGELKDYVIKGYSELLLRKTVSPRNDF
jgi:ribosomal protein S18 acetylase RimI-like enzyme